MRKKKKKTTMSLQKYYNKELYIVQIVKLRRKLQSKKENRKKQACPINSIIISNFM